MSLHTWVQKGKILLTKIFRYEDAEPRIENVMNFVTTNLFAMRRGFLWIFLNF